MAKVSVDRPVAPSAHPPPSRIGLVGFTTMFVIGTDTFLVAPLLPDLTRSFGVSTEVSGWMVSGYALGYALLALVAGPLSDRRDRRRVLLSGLLAFSAATALCGCATGFWSMVAFRFLAGAAAAFVSPQIWASIPALVPPGRIVRTMGLATAGLSTAQCAGIPLGGWLATVSWRLSFWTVGAVALVVWLVLLRMFPSVPAAPGAAGGLRATPRLYAAILGRRRLALFLLGYFVFQAGNLGSFSFVGTWLTRDFGLSTGSLSAAMVALGAGNVGGSLLTGRVAGRFGPRRALLLGLAVSVALFCALPFAPNLATALVLLSLIVGGVGFMFPVVMTLLQQEAGDARGTVASLANAVMYGGTTVGAALCGLLITGLDGFYGVAGFTVVTLLTSTAVFAASGLFRADPATA